jgi:hypothetical protein
MNVCVYVCVCVCVCVCMYVYILLSNVVYLNKRGDSSYATLLQIRAANTDWLPFSKI